MFRKVFRSRPSRNSSDSETNTGVVSQLERQYQDRILTESNSDMDTLNDGRPGSVDENARSDLPYGQTDPGIAYQAYTPPAGKNLVKIWVEQKGLATFDLPAEILSQHSIEFRRALSTPSNPNPQIFTRSPSGDLEILTIAVGPFFDFAQWICRNAEKSGEYQILENHHRNVNYAISAQISRLIGDVAVGLAFQSTSFQNAVIHDLYAVMPYHLKPEYFIEQLFKATSGWSLPESHPDHLHADGHITRAQRYRAAHPARRLLVEICAQKIGRGSNKRPLEEEIVDAVGDEIAKEFQVLFQYVCWHSRAGDALKPVGDFMLDVAHE